MDKMASIMLWISNWCHEDRTCEKQMIECAKKHIQEWDETKIILQCWEKVKK